MVGFGFLDDILCVEEWVTVTDQLLVICSWIPFSVVEIAVLSSMWLVTDSDGNYTFFFNKKIEID